MAKITWAHVAIVLIAAVLILGLVALLKSPKDLELEASTSSIRLKAFHPPAHASPR
jgi:hypothetical protein